MNDDKRWIFDLDAYSPDNIPMAKLAEYMADFAALLGKEHAVHFLGLEAGSTRIVARVEFHDVAKVTTRLHDVRSGDPLLEAAKVFAQIDDRLANDNAVGRILADNGDGSPPAELIAFPGRTRQKRQSYGPFTQDGHLDGTLISVGGKDETISLRLQNGDKIYANCETTRPIARELGKHLFESVRIYGSGRWVRETDGQWTLRHFKVHRFDVMENDSLRDTVAALRAVSGSGWKDQTDPLAELDDLRREKDELR